MKNKIIEFFFYSIFIAVALSGIFLMTTEGVKNLNKENYKYYVFKVEIRDTIYVTPESVSDTLTIENVKEYIRALGIYHEEIVLSQIILETGNLKSNACLNKNNLFGFSKSKSPMTFSNWKESVRYYANWQIKNYKNHDENYYDFLIRSNYAEDPQYINKLKKIKK